jgi:hypothetical protein
MPNLFPEADLQHISNILFEPKVEELKHRVVFDINEEYDSGAMEIGYDVYDRTGAAKVFAGRASAKDLPKVGDKKTRLTQKTYEIGDAIEYKRAELEAADAARRLGKGPALRLDSLRPATARRYIWEQESRLAYAGDSDLGVRGIFDNTFYGNDATKYGKKEDVAQGAYSGTVAQKRQWVNKTPQEIIEDLLTAKVFVEDGDIFQARTLVLPSTQYNRLKKPYGADTPQTTLKFIEQEGDYFQNIIMDNRLKAGNNGDTVDYFMVLDNRPEIVQLAVLQDIRLFNPVFDTLENSEQAVTLVTGGIILRYPMAVYIGKGI